MLALICCQEKTWGKTSPESRRRCPASQGFCPWLFLVYSSLPFWVLKDHLPHRYLLSRILIHDGRGDEQAGRCWIVPRQCLAQLVASGCFPLGTPSLSSRLCVTWSQSSPPSASVSQRAASIILVRYARFFNEHFCHLFYKESIFHFWAAGPKTNTPHSGHGCAHTKGQEHSLTHMGRSLVLRPKRNVFLLFLFGVLWGFFFFHN